MATVQETTIMSEALRQSSSRRVNAQERVRREIAAHLHGPVQGRLIALRAQLDALVSGNGISPETSRSLSVVADEIGQVIQRDIAVLSRRLYPAIVRRGLIPCLQSLVDQFEAVLRIELKVESQLASREKAANNPLPESTRLAAYRIVEEALTNVVKHARASAVVVEAGFDAEGWLDLAIRDTGPGFELDALQSGMGFAAMHDYAEAGGGACAVKSSPASGTSVAVRLPYPPPESLIVRQ